MSNGHSPDKGHDMLLRGSALCLACGLCCKGVLHDHAGLLDGETQLANELGLTPYTKKNDYQAFALPCPRHKNGKCSVYGQRPQVCSHYQCDLLKKYLKGRIDFEESIALVKKTKDLVDATYQYLCGADLSRRIWQQVQEFWEQHLDGRGSREFARANAPFLLEKVGQLLITLGRHFELRTIEKSPSMR